ncbi:uncharacterized protein SCDLUD_004413 [Saccharomycodes ludwigii]|uniref:uncharacterized protein n=1 Tax=Saccharomycodes ludwigii TaxID=36035 RepID=UPI001E85056C|nr:hypothetical protein SCDLUD_004413 [Saccharomycodes ludwigii]KAH3898992.1 hypothetical protein SCDLUD_004413 [Saccharomycodes ludwigii]
MVQTKRSRIPTVCRACRKRKSKCDRLRPQCSRCVESKTDCIYEQDISFLEPNIIDDPLSVSSSDSNTYSVKNFEKKGLSSSFSSSSPSSKNIFADPTVNLRNFPEPTMMILENTKYLDNPLSVVAICQKDAYLRTISGSIFCISHFQYEIRNDAQFLSVMQNILLKDSNNQVIEKPFLAFIEKIIERNAKFHNKSKPELWTPYTLFWNDYKLLDTIEDKPPLFLQNILHDIEHILPDSKITKLLLYHFYQNIYPIHPYLDIPSFDYNFNVLFKDSVDPTRHQIVLGTKNIRKKIVTVALLLLILKIASTSIVVGDAIEHIELKDYIERFKDLSFSRKTVIYAQKLYSLLNVMESSDEDGLAFLLYLNVYETYYPEDENLCLLQKQQLVYSAIHDVTKFLGLHRDPSVYPQLDDLVYSGPNYRNYRRKLWLGSISWRLSRLLTDGYSSATDVEELDVFLNEESQFLRNIEEDSVKELAYETPLYIIFIKKFHLYSMLLKLNRVCNKPGEGILLSEICKLMERCENVLANDFPLCAMSKVSDQLYPLSFEFNDNGFNSNSNQFNLAEIQATEIFNNNLLGRLCLLNISFLLMVYFEELTIKKPHEYGKLHEKFILETFRLEIELLSLITKYLEDQYSGFIPEKQAYLIKKNCFNVLLKCWMILVSFILRFSYAEQAYTRIFNSQNFLYNKQKNAPKQEQTILLTQQLLQKLSLLLKYTVHLSSEKLAKKYFCSYEATCVFSYISHLLDIGKIKESMERCLNLKDFLPVHIKRNANLKWRFDLNDASKIKDRLVDMNCLGTIDANLVGKLIAIFENVGFSFILANEKRDEFINDKDNNTYTMSKFLNEDYNVSQLWEGDLDEYFDFWDYEAKDTGEEIHNIHIR